MITVSLVHELNFISKHLDRKVVATLEVGEYSRPITISIEKDKLSVEYMNNLIWSESISKASSNFGVESCDSILKIMKRVRQGESWEMYPHIHK